MRDWQETSRRGRSVGFRRMALFLLVALAGGAIALLLISPPRMFADVPIEALAISIVGPGDLDVSEIRAALGVASGTPLRDIDRDSLCVRLEMAMPRISHVRLRGGWLHPLMLEVVERIPVCMVVDEDGSVREVASDGILLAPRRGTIADLPLLTWDRHPAATALVPGEVLDLVGAPDLMDLLARLQSEQTGLWRDISETHLHPDGTYELLWNDQPTVAWGRGPISSMRLQAWVSVMVDLRERGEQDAVIDLRFRDQIIVRLPGDVDAGRILG